MKNDSILHSVDKTFENEILINTNTQKFKKDKNLNYNDWPKPEWDNKRWNGIYYDQNGNIIGKYVNGKEVKQ